MNYSLGPLDSFDHRFVGILRDGENIIIIMPGKGTCGKLHSASSSVYKILGALERFHIHTVLQYYGAHIETLELKSHHRK